MSNEVANNTNSTAVQVNGGVDISVFQMASDEPVTGLESMNSSDIKLPKIKLLQSTSLEVTKSGGKLRAGQFYNTVTQEATDELECIFLNMSKSMVMWKQPFKRGEEPLCRSFDGITCEEGGTGEGKCQFCKFSSQNPKAWKELKDGETKPPCNMSYVWLGLEANTKMPFRIIMSGANVATTKDFLNKLAPMRIPPFCLKIKLTSEQQENSSGVFYVVKYSDPKTAISNGNGINTDLLDNTGKVIPAKMNEYKELTKTYKELFMGSIVQKDIIEISDDAHEEMNSTINTENGDLF